MVRSAALAALIAGSAIMMGAASASPRPASNALPRPAHVVIVLEENKSGFQIDGDKSAPYLNGLLNQGAYFTNAHGVTHPSLPNYLAIFAGVTNTNGDGCPAVGFPRNAPNLATELLGAHLTFASYAESLPSIGSDACWAGRYARKHAPWTEFTNVPPSSELPFSAFPKFDRLPTVSFVIPDLQDDMHDGSIAEGDSWLAKNLGPLVDWARTHNTLVVVTWDEGNDLGNTIPTIFAGPMVRQGRFTESIDHYRVLRTLEDMYGLPHAGQSGAVAPITDCWK
jgi:acid phosphatase